MAEVVGLSALQKRFTAIRNPRMAEGFMRTLGLRAVREQKLLVRRKTGNLGRSIHLASWSSTEALTTASARYAGFVEHGTRPHIITPRAARALAWAPGAAGGAFRRLSGAARKGAPMVFAMRVNHPGTQAYPYMLPGARKAIAEAGLTDEIVRAWNGAA